MNMGQRLIEPIPFLIVKVLIVLVRKLALILAPDRNHAVDGLFFHRLLKLVVAAFLRLAGGHIHLDRITDKVGILLDNASETVLVQIFIILVVFGILLDLQHDLRPYRIFMSWLNRVSVCPFGLPLEGLIAAESSACDGHNIGNHEGRIEPDPELADDIMSVLQLILVLERKRTALRNDAQVVLQLLRRHTDARIGDCQSPVCLVGSNLNVVIFLIKHQRVIA
ncbi:hypothetical protein D3C81_1263010 [compost metagenome]